MEPAQVSCLRMKIYMRALFSSLLYCVCVGRTKGLKAFVLQERIPIICEKCSLSLAFKQETTGFQQLKDILKNSSANRANVTKETSSHDVLGMIQHLLRALISTQFWLPRCEAASRGLGSGHTTGTEWSLRIKI